MQAILIHPFSGLLSAYGIGLSSVFASRQQACLEPLSEGSKPALAATIAKLQTAVAAELAAQGIAKAAIVSRSVLHLRYDGTDTTLPVDFSQIDRLCPAGLHPCP
jgi:5-oxoprolinase (ATP-hydrolysing)